MKRIAIFSKTLLSLATVTTLLTAAGCDGEDLDFEDSEVLDAEPAAPSEFTLEQLATLPYDEIEPGVFVHQGDDFTVEVERGIEGAKHYQQELESELAEVAELNTPEAQLAADGLRDELADVEELLASNTWDTQVARSNISSSVCQIQYNLSYKIIPSFYRFRLETTAETIANLIGPPPPNPSPGQIKAKAIINHESMDRVKNVNIVDFADTWAQSHEAIASSISPLHYSDDLQTWKAVAVLTSTGTCTGFQRIIVLGRASWTQSPIVDGILIQ